MKYKAEDIEKYRAECAQFVACGQEPSMVSFRIPLPKPIADEGTVYARCNRCGCTGRYCMSVVNGRPWSATGYTCIACGGLGYKLRNKPRKAT